MDWHDLMSTLAAQASDLDLLRLRIALDHLMQQPKRIMAIRARLQLGQEVDYLDLRSNHMFKGRIIEFRPNELLIQTAINSRYFWMPYATVQIDPNSTPVPPPPQPVRLGRDDFALGDTVTFEGRDLIRKFGTITRRNPKTASLACEDGLEWRVSYSLLQHVVNL